MGLVLDETSFTSVPSDLYKLRKSTGQKGVKLPIPKDIQLQHTSSALSSTSAWCLLDLWTAEIIIPKIKGMDELHSAHNTMTFDNAHIFQRSLTRGAILSCIADACGTTGIFALSQMDVFLRQPAIIFDSTPRQFAPEVVKKRDAVLNPLFKWIKAYLEEHPELSSKANQLGEITQLQMLELFVGKVSPPKAIPSSNLVDNLPETTRMAFTPIIFDKLISPECSQNIHIGPLGLILREALNRIRKLHAGDEILHRVLIGDHATRSSSSPKKSNPDHTNPIRQTLEAVSLLQTHLPGTKLTSKVGLSNLLSWMGTGQGYKTNTFLNSIDHPGGFFSSTLQQVIEIFQIIVDHNADIISQHPEHRRPQELPGIIAVDDILVWGQPNNLLSSAPTKDRIGNQIVKFSLLEKFSPYWTETVQTEWVNFLGEMLNQDPSIYTGPRQTWHQTLSFLNKLGIIGFGSGLTPFQLANHLVAFKIVDAPTVTDMADWISRHKKLGAYRGLDNLGFNLIPANPTSVRCAFVCIYRHLDEHLTQEDKNILFFGPILAEHILCKIPRWTGRLEDENAAGRLEQLASEAETENQQWNPGANINDHKAFPFPLVISKVWLQTIVDEVGAFIEQILSYLTIICIGKQIRLAADFISMYYCTILISSAVTGHRPSGNRSFVPGHRLSGRRSKTIVK